MTNEQEQHTTDKSNAEACGCSLNFSMGLDDIPHDVTLAFCPMHRAAEQMLAELEELYDGILASIESEAAAGADGSWLAIVSDNRRRVAACVAQARGQEVGA